MKTIKILFIDPALLFRKGFALYLNGVENLEVIHDLNGINELEEDHLKDVDVILFDTTADSDFRGYSKIQKEYPHIRLVALSAEQRLFENYLFISTSFSGRTLNGNILSSSSERSRTASKKVEMKPKTTKMKSRGAFLSKEVSPELVVEAIQRVVQENVETLIYPKNIREKLFGELHLRESFFSDKELSVLGLLGKGKSTQEAAQILNNSKRTVETHRRRMIERVGCKNIIPVILFALDHKYIRNETWQF